MAAPQQYDALVIGSGQGGTPLSLAFAQAGMKTALIERVHVGGTYFDPGNLQAGRVANHCPDLVLSIEESL